MTNIDKTGDHPELPKAQRPGKTETWECRVCQYKPNVGGKSFCVNCGRDWYGNPGRIPTDQPYRAGLKEGVTRD